MTTENPSALSLHHSYFEATARQRLSWILDEGSLRELMPPTESSPSPHLAALDIPGAFDDGVVIGEGALDNKQVFVISQEGQFMGGSVGEIHGAKIVGLLRRAIRDKPAAVLFLVDSGGVRLHEANAGLIAISEIMRAILDTRAAGIPVVALVGGSCGAFGGMGIVTCLCSAIVMSEEGRLALSGPEVIETVKGVEAFDSRDRALVWRVSGGKHRYLMNDCAALVEDDPLAFRDATRKLLAENTYAIPDMAAQMQEQSRLQARMEQFKDMNDGLQVWQALGVKTPSEISMMSCSDLIQLRKELYK
ncbi:biotin-independent malonate decarboxylase subunit beta [Advenella mimigardefordensis]|uniref:Putative malonate decarboxylase beta subunit n=1 Tax=Advenella mimigardefordensis (strain DSM 17166 / LMG 22922 / DPN7) TaxID=1247726 RepID=W0PBU6_ADVMD|nr:biotin-independent malonate decarboxylase subunit beta [Advenella mimigardefordensis]AHG62895.1 putative malonate decarboxylase beta subunit [Advenella mimigardefordensis DPN7]